jgi:hypothetical protein
MATTSAASASDHIHLYLSLHNRQPLPYVALLSVCATASHMGWPPTAWRHCQSQLILSWNWGYYRQTAWCAKAIAHTLHICVPAKLTWYGSGFGGLEVACWPLVPKFAGSHPAEAVGFLGRKNPQHAFRRSHVVALWQWLRWSRGSVLAFGTQVRGFTPDRSRRIFRAKKSPARLPSVPWRSFMACKRSLNVTWKSAFRQHSWTFLARSSTFRRWVLSRVDAWQWKLERLLTRIAQ